MLYAVLVLMYSMAHYHWLERPLHRSFKRILGIDQPGFEAKVVNQVP